MQKVLEKKEAKKTQQLGQVCDTVEFRSIGTRSEKAYNWITNKQVI